MRLSHMRPVASASFDDPNLVSAAGLVPIVALAERAGLRRLADVQLSVPTDKGANAGLKVGALVGGMVAGADSLEDMALLRHGGMKKLFDGCYAPSTLGQFLRRFTFGHVRQLDAVASRFLTGLAAQTPMTSGVETYALLDVDDTIVEVSGYAKQGSGYGYSGVRGLNALLATLSTPTSAPVIVGQRLRKGSCGSPRGAKRLVTDALTLVRRLRTQAPAPVEDGEAPRTLLRADSAFYGSPVVGAAVKAGADVSITVRLDPKVKAAIAGIAESAWTTIEYPDAVFDETAGVWISRAEVAEIPFTAFGSRKKAEQQAGRLVVRRIPDLNAEGRAGRPGPAVRLLAVPRLLHHQQPGHRHRGQDPPPARDHRAGPRRPEELGAGPPAVGQVRRQRRLAGPRGHGVQPHPRRRQHGRSTAPQGDHRHAASTTRPRPGPHRQVRPATDPAPAGRLALAERLDRPVHPQLRTTRRDISLTASAPPPPTEPGEPRHQVGQSPTLRRHPSTDHGKRSTGSRSSVDRGLAADRRPDLPPRDDGTTARER